MRHSENVRCLLKSPLFLHIYLGLSSLFISILVSLLSLYLSWSFLSLYLYLCLFSLYLYLCLFSLYLYLGLSSLFISILVSPLSLSLSWSHFSLYLYLGLSSLYIYLSFYFSLDLSTSILVSLSLHCYRAIFQYYVRARHMALKALNVNYQIPKLGDIAGITGSSTNLKKVCDNTVL